MNLLKWIATIITMADLLLGNCANLFIILVNSVDYIKRRKLSLADRIITVLAISRIGVLCAVLMNWYSSVLPEDTYSVHIQALSHIVWAISNHFTNWLGTTLSMFYLFRIATFSNLLFLNLKRKMENVLLVIFLGSFLFFIAYLGVVNMDKFTWVNLFDYEGNVTLKSTLKDITSLANVPLFSLINIVPFFISLTCVLLLIYSLAKHLRNIKFHGKGHQDPSTMVHIKALQTVASFTVLYATYSLCVILTGLTLSNAQISLFSSAIGALYPTGHSCILIWGNQKLKRALLLFLRYLRCCLRK